MRKYSGKVSLSFQHIAEYFKRAECDIFRKFANIPNVYKYGMYGKLQRVSRNCETCEILQTCARNILRYVSKIANIAFCELSHTNILEYAEKRKTMQHATITVLEKYSACFVLL